MKIIRGNYSDRISFGPDSVVAKHIPTGWLYYPSDPLRSDVHVTINDVTIGVYEVQYVNRDKEMITVKFNSDYMKCVRCHLICDPLEKREFGTCRWHTLAPLRMPLSEFSFVNVIHKNLSQ